MTKKLKGSRTEKNLMTAFAGESQARNRYTFYAEVARKEGYEQIAAIFEETAENERAHAFREFQFLEGGVVEIVAKFPAGPIGNTKENLRAAAAGEHEEWTKMYPEFEKVAREEGFAEIAEIFKEIGEVEEQHEKRFLALLRNLEKGEVFKKPKAVKWKCRNCGYVHTGPSAPKKCPACGYPQSYYELLCENY
ncbi:MAG: rubrerythrin family protein [Candidatus Hadarchaeales archaeon]